MAAACPDALHRAEQDACAALHDGGVCVRRVGRCHAVKASGPRKDAAEADGAGPVRREAEHQYVVRRGEKGGAAEAHAAAFIFDLRGRRFQVERPAVARVIPVAGFHIQVPDGLVDRFVGGGSGHGAARQFFRPAGFPGEQKPADFPEAPQGIAVVAVAEQAGPQAFLI